MKGPYIVQIDGKTLISKDVTVRDASSKDKEYSVVLEGVHGDLSSYFYGDLVSSVVVVGKYNILQYDQCALMQTSDTLSFMAFDGLARKRDRKV